MHVDLQLIEDKEEELVYLKESFLRKHGWTLDSTKAGGIWLWYKDQFGCSMETALMVERYKYS